jgi:hypothetical protein
MGEYTETEVVDVLEHLLAASPTYIWRELYEISQLLRRCFPDLNPKTFGYKGLRRLVQVYPKQFQTMWNNPKKKAQWSCPYPFGKRSSTVILTACLDQSCKLSEAIGVSHSPYRR